MSGEADIKLRALSICLMYFLKKIIALYYSMPGFSVKKFPFIDAMLKGLGQIMLQESNLLLSTGRGDWDGLVRL